MNVDPELLAAAAAGAEAEFHALLDAHAAADAAIGSARPGWIADSGSALEAAAGRWAMTTSELGVRVSGYAEALRISAATFAEMDARHAAHLAAVNPPR